MELLTAIAIFLSPYLVKAGEKVSEETIKAVFESHQDLAEKLRHMFRGEIISLGLNESSTDEETTKLLETKPEVQVAIRQKIESNQDLINQLTEALSKQEGRTITCKTYIENIENIEVANFS